MLEYLRLSGVFKQDFEFFKTNTSISSASDFLVLQIRMNPLTYWHHIALGFGGSLSEHPKSNSKNLLYSYQDLS